MLLRVLSRNRGGNALVSPCDGTGHPQCRRTGLEEEPMGAIGSPIVVGYVDSPEGQAALDRAIVEAEQRSARLVVISSNKGGAAYDKTAAAAMEQVLADVRARLAAAGVEFEVRQLVRGEDPADDIIHVADEVDADLIVIGLRRRTPVGKLILGSNAQQVLLDASCPVLAVKA
jgi:nucleotide-binding universal stress UspA family protein